MPTVETRPGTEETFHVEQVGEGWRERGEAVFRVKLGPVSLERTVRVTRRGPAIEFDCDCPIDRHFRRKGRCSHIRAVFRLYDFKKEP